jgi:hypothetical protein
MRRFKIGSANRFFLLGGIALGSQLGLGASPAMAAIYDFSFNSSLGAGSIELDLSGQNVTGAGSGTGILAGGSLSTSPANNAHNWGTLPLVLSTSNAPFFSENTPNFVFIDTSSDQFAFGSNTTGDAVEEYTPGADGTFFASSYLSNESMTQTPAPLPGSGPLSYLALGVGGLFFYRKRLWRASRMAVGLAV